MKVYILTKEYDYNGRLIIDVYASREAAELERKRLGVMPQYIEDDLIIDERELMLYCHQCGTVDDIADSPFPNLIRRAWAALAWLDGSIQLSDRARAYAAKRLREALENVEGR